VDLVTIIGLVIAFGAILVSLIIDGGHISAFFQPGPILLVFGASIGVTAIGYRGGDLRKVPELLKGAFVKSKQDPEDLIERLVRMAEKARREGLLALQDDVPTLDHPLLVRGIQMIVDGIDPAIVKETLDTQVELTEHQRLNAAGALDAAGGYAPTIGILGTIMHLVEVLSNLSQPEKLGGLIAAAFLAAMWGVASANLIFLPLGSKVKQNIQNDALIARMCIAGVVGLQTGEAPRALREKLEVYITPKPRRGIEVD
jgi:chemotaxis protein MotA